MHSLPLPPSPKISIPDKAFLETSLTTTKVVEEEEEKGTRGKNRNRVVANKWRSIMTMLLLIMSVTGGDSFFFCVCCF